MMSDDAGVYHPDKVRWYRTMATNSQLGDLLRHEDDLIAKVGRLEAENATLHERLAAAKPLITATANGAAWYQSGENHVYYCAFCDRSAGHPAMIDHLSGCFVVQARAWLAASPAQSKLEGRDYVEVDMPIPFDGADW